MKFYFSICLIIHILKKLYCKLFLKFDCYVNSEMNLKHLNFITLSFWDLSYFNNLLSIIFFKKTYIALSEIPI